MTGDYRPYRVEVQGHLRVLSPLHIGSGERLALATDAPLLEEEVLLDEGRTESRPYIPGTSIRGALRDHLEREAHMLGCSRDSIDGLFGKAPERRQEAKSWAGRFALFDSYTDHANVCEVRDHVRMNREWAAADYGAKFDGEVALPGQVFLFQAVYEGDSSAHEELILLREAIHALERGDITLGAKSGWGYGRVALENAVYRVYNRSSASGLAAFLSARLGSPASAASEFPDFRPIAKSHNDALRAPFSVLEFHLRLHCSGPVLVKAPIPPVWGEKGDVRNPETYASAGLSEADHVFISQADENGTGEYYLPGSSLRGVLRSQGDRISATLGNEASEVLFGSAKSGGTRGRRGFIEVGDGQLVKPAQPVFLDHVAIDRITAAAVDAKKFSLAALASPKFNVTIRLRYTEAERQVVALWGFLLRDLMGGRLWVGSGVTRGYGYIESADILEVTGNITRAIEGIPYVLETRGGRSFFRSPGAQNFADLDWLWGTVQSAWGAK